MGDETLRKRRIIACLIFSKSEAMMSQCVKFPDVEDATQEHVNVCLSD